MGATAKLMSAAAGNIKGVIFPGDAAALDGAQNDPRLGHAEQLKDELDEIVASECALCGDIMIKSIDQPFIADDDVDVIASWTV